MKNGWAKLDLIPICCKKNQTTAGKSDKGTDLMVDIMIICVILRKHLQRVEGETISAMVVDGLESRDAEQERSLSSAHS